MKVSEESFSYRSPTCQLRVERVLSYAAVATAVSVAAFGGEIPYLKKWHGWQRFIIGGTPFAAARYFVGRREATPLTLKERVAATLRWFLWPIGRSAVYQGAHWSVSKCCGASRRRQAWQALGANALKVESLHKRKSKYTQRLDGIRVKCVDFLEALDKQYHDDNPVLESMVDTVSRLRKLDGLQKTKPNGELVMMFPAFGGHAFAYVEQAIFFLLAGYDVQFVDFPGYGRSEGYMSADTTCLATQAMVESLPKEYQQVVCYGHCAGSPLAAHAAKALGDKLKACILDRFVLTMGDVPRNQLPTVIGPLLGAVVDFLYPYHGAEDCRAFREKLLLIRGIDDPFLSTPRELKRDRFVQPLVKELALKSQRQVLDVELNDNGHFDNWFLPNSEEELNDKNRTAVERVLKLLGA